MSMLRISINLAANAEGTLSYDGKSLPCLGKKGMTYPKDVINSGEDAKEKFKSRYSSEYRVQMEWAILLGWERGLFIHEGPATLKENGGESAGCIHIAKPDAEKLWRWVTGPTRITLTAPWL
jgi:lipoprotein-anchoring transpeptidase ErfK/SrfK